MKRTTISLPDDVAAALEREARRRRVPVSQVAREAIEARLGWDEGGPRAIPFEAIGDSAGGANLSEYIDSDAFTNEYAHWIQDNAFSRDR
jgi:Ribbon-helix-helix protein, copG family